MGQTEDAMDVMTEKVMDIVTTHYKLIEGRVKTVLEASVTEDRQTEAAKRLAAQSIWSTWDSVKHEVEKMFDEAE